MTDNLETEFDEFALAEQETEPNDILLREDDSAETDCCGIEMGQGDQLRCLRPLHPAPAGADEKPVCLMHSQDPNKRSGLLFDAFWKEFERTLEEAGEGVACFESFVFPFASFISRSFNANCIFSYAVFTENAAFPSATFRNDVKFEGATFMHSVDFTEADFKMNSIFNRATFQEEVYFVKVNFGEIVSFSEANFKQNAEFYNANFLQLADFGKSTFERDAQFMGARFASVAIFSGTNFNQAAFFDEVLFLRPISFWNVTFSQTAYFLDTEFHGTARWQRTNFMGGAEFWRTKFIPEVDGTPSAVFTVAKFAKPAEISFDETDLSRVLFYGCDVSEVRFTSSVKWGKMLKRNAVLFEEKIPINQEYASLQISGERDYRAIAQVYQQLKKNYDSHLDYWTANEFHFGEMEMKRLAVPTNGQLLRARQWAHRCLSLLTLYRYASDYGNSYVKPILWQIGTLILCAALLPIPGVGLKEQGAIQPETYASTWLQPNSVFTNFSSEVHLFGKGIITAVDVATFQRTPEYAPMYPWGRVLAIFESLLTSTLFALFLLAIRRQFKR